MMLILCLTLPVVAFAGSALEAVKTQADRVLEVLRDPAFKPESAKKVKIERIRSVSDKMFDFTELSKRTLGKSWDTFNPEQQKEFVRLYRSLLEDAYADKILSYSDEKILFNKEVPLTEKTSEVQSSVLRSNGEIPIYYRVVLKGGTWKVYDVVIEGVSLISNYRSQFREILMNKQPEALLETLRKKSRKS
jgi:phospholipid transport system substrate-binding protein